MRDGQIKYNKMKLTTFLLPYGRSHQLLPGPATGWAEEGRRRSSGEELPASSPPTRRLRPLWRQRLRPGSLLAAEVRIVIDPDQ